METFPLTIVTPEALAFEGSVESVDLPGMNGRLGVLAHHAPLIAAIDPGVVTIRAGDGRRFFLIDAGFFEVRDNAATLLTGGSTEVSSIDEGRRLQREAGGVAPRQVPLGRR